MKNNELKIPKSKKKILHLVEAFGGGVFTFLVELANATCEDYEVVIAYSKRKQTPKNFKEYFKENIRFIEVQNFTRSIGIKDFKACKEIRKIIKKENPDIVHMHSSKAGIIGRLVISSRKRKLLYTPHGYSFLKQDDSKLKRLMYKSIEKITAIYRKKCTIVACSEGEYKESLRLNKNSTYVNNGINITEIDKILENNKIKSIDKKQLKICTVGRIGFQKNPETFNEIAKRFPNISFTWIGDGELKEKLTSPNIKVTGWADRKEVLRQVAENDIFILPSLWEGLPIALLEAMYIGKVCIVSNVIGNKDVIQNGKNGFLCNNLNEYITVINEIILGKYNLCEISENAVNDIKENYNTDIMCNNYKKIYKNIKLIEMIGLPGSGKSTYVEKNIKSNEINILKRVIYKKNRIYRNLKKVILCIKLFIFNNSVFIKVCNTLKNVKFKNNAVKIKMKLYMMYTLQIIISSKKREKSNLIYIDEGILNVILSIAYVSDINRIIMTAMINEYKNYIGDEVIFIDTDLEIIKERLTKRENSGGSELEHDILKNNESLEKSYENMKIIIEDNNVKNKISKIV